MAASKQASGVTRRDFISTGVASAVAAAAIPQTSLMAALPKTPGYIDAHVHVWTPDLKNYPLADGFRREDMKPPSFTPEELFSHARPQGVSRIVLIQMSYYRYDNSYMLNMMQQHKGVFSGVAVIDENSRPAETMLEMKTRGVRGFRIRPEKSSPEQWLRSEGMKAMWQCGAENGLAMCHLIDAKFLSSVDRMCRENPDTPVVIDHFARIGVDGVVREKDIATLCRLAQHRNVSVKISAFYALGKKKAPYTDLLPMIRRLLDAYGPERLMWASDGPFQVVGGHQYGPSINLIREHYPDLSAGDRQWLLRKTAERVFYS